MKNINITKYIKSFLVCILVGTFACACSDDEKVDINNEGAEKIQLSIALNSPNQDSSAPNIRSTGNKVESENYIYSLAVFVFKSGSEEGIDGSAIINKEVGNDGEYKIISEIKGVEVTAGLRDIYVVANAPDGYFNDVTGFRSFKEHFEALSTQGQYAHPGTVAPNESEDPIGGLKPSDLQVMLTMCGSVKNVQFSNLNTQHYLGYTDDNGRPSGITTGFVLPGNGDQLDPVDKYRFYVERLVARVAVETITFDFPSAGLIFEGSTRTPKDDYTYQLDSVFMMNVKTTSVYSREEGSNKRPLGIEFAHGSRDVFNFFTLNPLFRTPVLGKSKLETTLTEPIYTRSYNIAENNNNDSPLWFYTFENDESEDYPTYLVVGVKYNFISSLDGKAKTMKCYYPVVINVPDPSKPATVDHDFIKRNYQYALKIKIQGLGYKLSVGDLKKSSMSLSELPSMEVETSVGHNLFPWTGNIYNK